MRQCNKLEVSAPTSGAAIDFDPDCTRLLGSTGSRGAGSRTRVCVSRRLGNGRAWELGAGLEAKPCASTLDRLLEDVIEVPLCCVKEVPARGVEDVGSQL